MTNLTLTEGAVRALLDETRSWGSRGVETGGFLLRAGDGPARCVALAAASGISRRHDYFMVSGRAIAQLFRWAEDQELAVVAQVHSHRCDAFLSKTDLQHGFSVRGFISAVIPRFASPPPHLPAWGWWRFEGVWQQTVAPSVTAGSPHIVRFDEDGVRAA